MSVLAGLRVSIPNKTLQARASDRDTKRVLLDHRALFLFPGESDPGPTWRLLRRDQWR